MGKSRVGSLSRLLAFILLLLPAVRADAAIGRCYLEVDYKIYLNSECNIEPVGAHGGFSIGAGEATRSRYFAYVQSDENGTGIGYWNGPEGESHAGDSLGTLSRNGPCWENARAKVCAWR
jgi:hypothetical protein